MKKFVKKKHSHHPGEYKGGSHESGRDIPIEILSKGGDVIDTARVEGQEYHICADSLDNQEVLEFKQMTNKDVLTEIFKTNSCEFHQGEAHSSDFIVRKTATQSPTLRDYRGTAKSIINQMQQEHGGRTTSDSTTMEEGGQIANYQVFFMKNEVRNKLSFPFIKYSEAKQFARKNVAGYDRAFVAKKHGNGYTQIGHTIYPEVKINPADVAEEKNIHQGTFEKIKAGEIQTPEDLAVALTVDHEKDKLANGKIKILYLQGYQDETTYPLVLFMREQGYDVMAPEIDYDEKPQWPKLVVLTKRENPDLIIGHSLGGYFAYDLSAKYSIPALLLSPALDGSWDSKQPIPHVNGHANTISVIGENDDEIRTAKVKSFLSGFNQTVYTEDMGHQVPLPIFEKYLDMAVRTLVKKEGADKSTPYLDQPHESESSNPTVLLSLYTITDDDHSEGIGKDTQLFNTKGNLAKGGFVKPKEATPEELRTRMNKKINGAVTLSNNIRSLKSTVSRDLKSDNEKERLTALIVALMLKTSERIGNSTSAAGYNAEGEKTKDGKGHYGISGLRKKHVKIVGDKVYLDYTGKSGVDHEKEFTDHTIAQNLKWAIKNSPKLDIFVTSKGFKINNTKVNRYLSAWNLSNKDIRGFLANKWLLDKLKSSDIPKEESDRKKKFLEALKSIAKKVGHGRATLKTHYLLPEIEEQYIEHGKIADIKKFEEGGEVGENTEASAPFGLAKYSISARFHRGAWCYYNKKLNKFIRPYNVNDYPINDYLCNIDDVATARQAAKNDTWELDWRSVTWEPFHYFEDRMDRTHEWVYNSTHLNEMAKGGAVTSDSTAGYLNAEQIALVNSPAFKKWSDNWKSVIKDENGEPKVLFHGTTHKFFVFNRSMGNVENHFGLGYYFTDSLLDVQTNYLKEGPDLTQRIELLAERFEQESIAHAKAVKKAEKELKGGAEIILRCFVKMTNPLDLTENGTTYDALETYDEDNDEYTENPNSLAVKLYNSIMAMSAEYDFRGTDGQKIFNEISEKIGDNFDGTRAVAVDAAFRECESIMDIIDKNGDLASNEFIRRVYEDMGFDGIIMDADKAFGHKRKFGQAMQMDEGTKHYIVFNSDQIKLADGTNTTFDGSNQDIRYKTGGAITAKSYANLIESPAFKKWFNGSKVVDKKGKPIVVWHGSGSDFNVFDRTKLGSSQGPSPANKIGFYFSDNRNVALSFSYSTPTNWRIYGKGKLYTKPYFLSIKNPAILDCKGEGYSTMKHKINDFVAKLEYPKHDGAILLNYKDSMKSEALLSNQYIVYYSEQIKLADGTNTTFDGDNPDIRYAAGGKINNNMESTPIQKIKDAQAQAEATQLFIKKTIEDACTVQNPDVTPNPDGKSFTISSSKIGTNNWDPRFHDYREQKQHLLEAVNATDISKLEERLREVFATREYKGFKFNPDFLATIQHKLYGDEVIKQEKTTDLTVAKEIRKQIGQKALFMLGADNFAGDEKSLSFRIKGSNNANHIKITLTGADDYTMEFGKIWGGMYRIVNTVRGVYADMLNKTIEENTGLYTKLFESGGTVSIPNLNLQDGYTCQEGWNHAGRKFQENRLRKINGDLKYVGDDFTDLPRDIKNMLYIDFVTDGKQWGLTDEEFKYIQKRYMKFEDGGEIKERTFGRKAGFELRGEKEIPINEHIKRAVAEYVRAHQSGSSSWTCYAFTPFVNKTGRESFVGGFISPSQVGFEHEYEAYVYDASYPGQGIFYTSDELKDMPAPPAKKLPSHYKFAEGGEIADVEYKTFGETGKLSTLGQKIQAKYRNRVVFPDSKPITDSIHCADINIDGIEVRCRFYSPEHKGEKGAIAYHILMPSQIHDRDTIHKGYEFIKNWESQLKALGEKEYREQERERWNKRYGTRYESGGEVKSSGISVQAISTHIEEGIDQWIFSALVDCHVVGSARLTIMPAKENKSTKDYIIDNLTVADSERQKGIGLHLLRAAESKILELGHTEVLLWVDKDSWQKEWYERQGYVVYDDTDGENVWMKKNIKKAFESGGEVGRYDTEDYDFALQYLAEQFVGAHITEEPSEQEIEGLAKILHHIRENIDPQMSPSDAITEEAAWDYVELLLKTRGYREKLPKYLYFGVYKNARLIYAQRFLPAQINYPEGNYLDKVLAFAGVQEGEVLEINKEQYEDFNMIAPSPEPLVLNKLVVPHPKKLMTKKSDEFTVVPADDGWLIRPKTGELEGLSFFVTVKSDGEVALNNGILEGVSEEEENKILDAYSRVKIFIGAVTMDEKTIADLAVLAKYKNFNPGKVVFRNDDVIIGTHKVNAADNSPYEMWNAVTKEFMGTIGVNNNSLDGELFYYTVIENVKINDYICNAFEAILNDIPAAFHGIAFKKSKEGDEAAEYFKENGFQISELNDYYLIENKA